MQGFFKKQKIFIIAQKIGGLSNRLFLFANLISCALENNAVVFNPSFEEYAKYFVGPSKDVFCRHPPKRLFFVGMKFWRSIYCRMVFKINSKIKNRNYRLFYHIALPAQKGIYRKQNYPRKFFYLEDAIFWGKIKERSIIFFEGLYFWDGEILAKHHDEIIKYFRPLPKYERSVKGKLDHIKNTCQILVGVHIRRGDYKKWRGGEFLYNNHQYKDVMGRVLKLLRDKTVTFLIVSDEDIEKKDFEGYDVAICSGNFIEDQLCLAACDYIVGPPSTYSMWASFYGKVPFYAINDPVYDFCIKDFNIVSSLSISSMCKNTLAIDSTKEFV